MDSQQIPAVDAGGKKRKDFRLKRQNETGLSIVIPWYEVDGEEGISKENVIAAVLRGFFYPILMGHLTITIATPAEELTLNADTLIPKVEAMGGGLAMEILPIIKLAEWAQTRVAHEFLALLPPSPDRAQSWSPELVPAELIKQIRQSLAQRQSIAIKVPMFVRPRTNGPLATHFKVFIEHSDEDRDKPAFIRDELVISDVKCPRTSQVRALVIVEDAPIAALLRDAETPAHTQWNPGTSKFKDKYINGPSAIRFVSHSVSELLRIINQSEQQPDPSITIDFFSVPKPPEDDEAVPARRRRPRNQPGGGEPPQPPLPPPTPPRFRIAKLEGGFGIRAGDPNAPLPSLIQIRVAYDIRRGNPLRKYHEADFDLGRAPIRQTNANGIVVRSASDNLMVIAVQNPGFNLDVLGFDTQRELYVKAEAKEDADVDQAN